MKARTVLLALVLGLSVSSVAQAGSVGTPGTLVGRGQAAKAASSNRKDFISTPQLATVATGNPSKTLLVFADDLAHFEAR